MNHLRVFAIIIFLSFAAIIGGMIAGTVSINLHHVNSILTQIER